MPARVLSGDRRGLPTNDGGRGSRFPAFICKWTPSGVDPAVSRNDQHRFPFPHPYQTQATIPVQPIGTHVGNTVQASQCTTDLL